LAPEINQRDNISVEDISRQHDPEKLSVYSLGITFAQIFIKMSN
jgi:hypothetical protein